LLPDLSKSNTFLIPKIVYGELSLIFRTTTDLTDFLTDTGILVGDIPREAYIVAAKRWDTYNKRRVLVCHRCGKKLRRLACKECGSPIKIRQNVLSDFLIGAYALQLQERRIVTHDAGYYATYFPELRILSA